MIRVHGQVSDCYEPGERLVFDSHGAHYTYEYNYSPIRRRYEWELVEYDSGL